MPKYLFITYGEPGWRGVQMRVIRIAAYFKKSDILFWNLYDSAFIKSYGFTVETKNAGLTNPQSIIFPKGIETVIFADLPSNELFEYCVYRAALLQGKRIVICEQLYKKGQFSETVMARFVQSADLVLVNSISAFANEGTSKIKIVPPQIEMMPDPGIKKRIYKKYGIAENAKIIFGAGYHAGVFKKIEQVTEKLEKKKIDFYTVVSKPGVTEIKKKGKLILIPQVSGEDYFSLLYTADLVLVKFGFLQILESLALHKPTIVLGEAGQVLQNPKALDPIFKRALFITEKITNKTQIYIEKLLTNEKFRKDIVTQLKEIHNGELFGAKKAAELILRLSQKKNSPKKMPKKLAILVNKEIWGKDNWLKNNENIYPICFVVPMPTTQEVFKRIPESVFTRKIKDFQEEKKGELLPHSFRNVYVFSRRKYDGFTDISSWFEDWIENLERLLNNADEIYITEQGEKMMGDLLKNKSLIEKVRKI